MTHNEKRLLLIFLSLGLLALVTLAYASRLSRLHELDGAIAYYEKSLMGLKDANGGTGELSSDASELADKLRRLKEGQTGGGHGTERLPDLPSTVAYLRASLENEGIRPDRYTVTGKTPKRFIEFSLRARPVALFRFLKKQAEDRWIIEFSSLTMKYLIGSPEYETVFRIAYEE